MRRSIAYFAAACAMSLGISAAAQAQGTPSYSRTEDDCVTNGNKSVHGGKANWSIGAGCDSYQNEVYERPTTQTYTVQGSAFGAEKYLQNIDIKTAKVGANSTFMWVSIEMVGGKEFDSDPSKSGEFKGLDYQYNFLMSTNANGAGGYLFTIDNPDDGGSGNPSTAFSPLVAKGYQDTNNDVGGGGGISFTKQDDLVTMPLTEAGNGFDLARINDGKILNGANSGSTVLFARIDPTNPNAVEFALDYTKLGFNSTQIGDIIAGNGLLDVRAIKGDPKSPANYLWNDEYKRSEAGSPYRCVLPSTICTDTSKSEFKTQGLGNIYELDTFRFGKVPVIPEASTWAMLIAGFGLVGATMRRRSRAVLA